MSALKPFITSQAPAICGGDDSSALGVRQLPPDRLCLRSTASCPRQGRQGGSGETYKVPGTFLTPPCGNEKEGHWRQQYHPTPNRLGLTHVPCG